jgi:hypothetical protein
MILFKFPQKKIVLDCFTTKVHVLETAPIVPAIKLMPEWWKQLPNSIFMEGTLGEMSTMRSCVGMTDYYKKSIAIPMWSDLRINIESSTSYGWQFSDPLSQAQYHDMKKQATGFLDGYAHVKLVAPWYLKTKEDVSWVWSHPAYSFPDSHNIVPLPGVVNFLHQRALNANMLFFAEKPKTIFIPQGQTLAHLIPMSDRKVEIVRHLVNEKEYERIASISTPITFMKKYENNIKRKEQFKDCPFHNHTGEK